MTDSPDPELLRKAVADREARPWRYYRLEHDVMKKMLEEMTDQLAEAQARIAQLRKAINPNPNAEGWTIEAMCSLAEAHREDSAYVDSLEKS